MNRKRALEAYDLFSARTSENVRGLSYAALAVIWLFRPQQGLDFPRSLVLAGLSAVIALAADFLHSLYGTVIWGWIHRRKELAGIPAEESFKNHPAVNWPTNAFFIVKVLAVVASYGILLKYLLGVVGVLNPPLPEGDPRLPASPALSGGFAAAESLATVAVAFLATVQIVRELRRERERRKGVTAKIGVLSYQIRRQLISWIGDGGASSFDAWIRGSSVKEHLDIAESRMSELVGLAPDAPKAAAAAIRRAYVRFYTGTGALNAFVQQERPRLLSDEINWLALRTAAKDELIQVVTELERYVIDKHLLTEEHSVLNTRDETGLIAQLAGTVEDAKPRDKVVDGET